MAFDTTFDCTICTETFYCGDCEDTVSEYENDWYDDELEANE